MNKAADLFTMQNAQTDALIAQSQMLENVIELQMKELSELKAQNEREEISLKQRFQQETQMAGEFDEKEHRLR